jgi:CBS domain-containing protein
MREEAEVTQLREFMHTPIFSCSPTTSLAKAAREMEAHNVGSLVLTDDDKRIVGMVTDRDLALAIGRGYAPNTTVDTVCVHTVVTIASDADVHEAVSLMGSRGIWRLPVADSSGHAVGMVSLNDLFGCLAEETRSFSEAAHAHGLART